MVDFKLVYQDETVLKYEYYPEGKMDKQPGIITINLNVESIKVTKKAEEDMLVTQDVEEQNYMREAVNEMRREIGEAELTEEEWPIATEEMSYFYYGHHAVRRIADLINSGEIPKNGTVMWY